MNVEAHKYVVARLYKYKDEFLFIFQSWRHKNCPTLKFNTF